jgi:peptidoglycan/xylan/chitin deacetylase (PgdA/CDA1 family)
VQAIVQRSVDGVTPGTILLLHDGDGYAPIGDRMQTALAVPKIIDQLRGRGYSFSTLPV